MGVVEDGKYLSVTEDQQQAMFLPSPQSPTSAAAYIAVRSQRDPQELAEAIRSKVRELDAGLPVDTQTWNSMLTVVMFPSRMATMSLGVLGVMGAMLSITGIFGMAAYSVSKRLREFGIRVALGAQTGRDVGGGIGSRNQTVGGRFSGGAHSWDFGNASVGFHRVSGDSP